MRGRRVLPIDTTNAAPSFADTHEPRRAADHPQIPLDSSLERDGTGVAERALQKRTQRGDILSELEEGRRRVMKLNRVMVLPVVAMMAGALAVAGCSNDSEWTVQD